MSTDNRNQDGIGIRKAYEDGKRSKKTKRSTADRNEDGIWIRTAKRSAANINEDGIGESREKYRQQKSRWDMD